MRILRTAFVALVSSLFLVSCASPWYSAQWDKAAQNQSTHQPTDLSGAWEGTWESHGTGHQGTLKAIVTLAPEGKPGAYLFHYKATWAKVLSGTYKTVHLATPAGSGTPTPYTISGEHDMGKLFGGMYQYSGTATATQFEAKYKSNGDWGIFRLHRPKPAPPSLSR